MPLRGGEGEGVGPELGGGVMGRPLVGGYVAAGGPDGLVEGRVARPGPEDAVVEVVAVHLGLDEVPVYPLGHRPAGGVDGQQSLPQTEESGPAVGKGGGGVVGGAVAQERLFESAPVGEEGGELVLGGEDEPR